MQDDDTLSSVRPPTRPATVTYATPVHPPRAELRSAHTMSRRDTGSTFTLSHRPSNISEIPQVALRIEQNKVSDLTVQVGTHSFAFWFVVSSYLPIVTACFSPITTMMSIAALITKWRMTPEGEYHEDAHQILVLNSVSLALGALANISLVLNYSRRLTYIVSQIISISMFFAAFSILLSGILVADSIYYETDQFVRTEGFWFAVLTTILYFMCASTCLLNFSGYLLGKYPPDFNLEESERGLIFYTFLLSVWFLWGSGMFSKLIGLSFGDAMYYCCISLLTIGLGDILPDTNAAKAMCLVFSLSGIIILGLIIAMIRSTINSMSAPVLFWNQVEEHRKKIFKRVKNENISLTSEEGFDLMRSIRRDARAHRGRISIIVTIGLFIAFWLIGALIFHFTEGWNYFDAVYFCFLCLITIGYGDFAPASAAGRPIFVLWSLGAVPLMTALISSVGDTVYELAVEGRTGKLLEKILGSNTTVIPDEELQSQNIFSQKSSDDIDEEEERSPEEILEEAKMNDPRRQRLMNSRDIMENLKKFMTESKDNPKKKYTFDEWDAVLNLLDIEILEDNHSLTKSDPAGWFWISETSPLRFPISEPDYLLYLLFTKVEKNIEDRLEDIENELERVETSKGSAHDSANS